MPLPSKHLFRRVFIRDRLVLATGAIALGLQLITWIILLWRGLPLRGEELLPLHYTIYFGIDLIGPWYGIFTPALFGLVILIINISIILAIYERHRFFAHTFALGTAFIELVLLASSFFVLLLNQ